MRQTPNLLRRQRLLFSNEFQEETIVGEWTKLKASDAFELSAYVAGNPKSTRGLVVVQEVFGVNNHIRNVCERYAKDGFLVIAPALFDRVERGIELAYDDAGIAKGVETVGKVSMENALKDVAAALGYLGNRKKAVIGFCWGGTVAWVAASQFDGIEAAVGFYGGGIAASKDLKLKHPVQLHFGAEDPHIPQNDVSAISQAHPEIDVFSYPGAGHGFCCDERGSYHEKSAALAKERAVSFLTSNMAD
jgi:carboxymethylenebutenolidase